MVAFKAAWAYEINNHADMSQVAAFKSVLNIDNSANGKLFRLGLAQRAIDSNRQTFPLLTPQISAATPLERCFGQYQRLVIDALGRPILDAQGREQIETLQDSFATQPAWSNAEKSGTTPMTIAQAIRFGACWEDSEEPKARSLAHFYNPQNGGAGMFPLPTPEPPFLAANPDSINWMLNANLSTTRTKLTGAQHYGYADARNSFYNALTVNTPGVSAVLNANNRNYHWGQTFQALGHLMHHLQDMASPQHVRSDHHCDDKVRCKESYNGLAGALGGYKPSAYEKHHGSASRFTVIQQLAQSATAPILFGLPREFWNINTTQAGGGSNTSGAITTNNPQRVMQSNEGIAAYTSTNYTSMGKNFEFDVLATSAADLYLPAAGLALPKPSGQWRSTGIAELYADQPALVEDIRIKLCAGVLSSCTVEFMGTAQNSNARSASQSIFGNDILFNPTPSFVVDGRRAVFTQNYFTHNDAATTLIPLATRYSAGLIDYFFRGELQTAAPESNLYGMLTAYC